MSALAIEITSERTALVSGAGVDEVELSAEKGQSIHAVIAQFSRKHSADAGAPVEVIVQEAGRSRQLTVAPDGKVSQSLPHRPDYDCGAGTGNGAANRSRGTSHDVRDPHR